MLSLTYTGHFDAAHYLPHYEGKCHQLHGHTWKYKITVKPEIENTLNLGMITDFGDFKNLLQEHIENTFDHNLLNNVLPNPTCEEITLWMVETLKPIIKPLILTKIQVYESPNTYITWRADE